MELTVLGYAYCLGLQIHIYFIYILVQYFDRAVNSGDWVKINPNNSYVLIRVE